MTLIADASSLILLAKSSVLSTLIEKNKILIPETVYNEIIKGKDKGMQDAFIIETFVKNDKIRIEKVEEIDKKKIKELFGLWRGECEVISLAMKKNQPIITDDKKCLNAAKAINAKFMTAIDIITALYLAKQIDKKKALEALDVLEKFGWYKREIILNYKEKIK